MAIKRKGSQALWYTPVIPAHHIIPVFKLLKKPELPYIERPCLKKRKRGGVRKTEKRKEI